MENSIRFYSADTRDTSIIFYGAAIVDGKVTDDKKYKITWRDGYYYLLARTTRMYFLTGFKSKSSEECKKYAFASLNEDYDTMDDLRKNNFCTILPDHLKN